MGGGSNGSNCVTTIKQEDLGTSTNNAGGDLNQDSHPANNSGAASRSPPKSKARISWILNRSCDPKCVRPLVKFEGKGVLFSEDFSIDYIHYLWYWITSLILIIEWKSC